MPLRKDQMPPLLALLSAFPALSTDMYLPALPTLARQWQQPMAVINLTLFGFFLTYGLFLLIYGPLSDRYGRRSVLLVGLSVYVAGSLMCALAWGAKSLIAFRVLQAAGAASASALSMAMCKDLFDGKERVKILAHIAVIMTIAPMVGPLVGGFVMTYLIWPFVFVVQAALGAISLVGVLGAPETLEDVGSISPVIIFKNYYSLLTNGRFMAYTLMMAGVGFPFFAFLGGASDIYITLFGLSKQQFGYIFSFNAFAIMLGAWSCGRLLGRIDPGHLITVGYGGVMIGGLIIYQIGGQGPWYLALSMALTSFALGLSRPPNNNLVLEQIDRNVGAASSLLVFFNMMCGAVAMEIVALNWENKIRMLGTFGIICGAVVLAFWLILKQERNLPLAH